MDKIELGEKIKELRDRKGCSLRDLEELTGISNANLSRIEQGKGGSIQLDTLNVIIGSLDAKLVIIKKATE